MYELTWNKTEQVKEYEKLVQDVIKTCFEEENLQNTKLYINIIMAGNQKKFTGQSGRITMKRKNMLVL